MIIRKPYAFLIKRFRLIHGFLFIMLVYLISKTLNIYSFFSNYASTGSYTNTGNLENIYINYLMFIVTLLTIGVSFMIYYVLSVKKKSNKIYLAMFVYYIIQFVFFMYMYSVFSGLNQTAIDVPSRTLMVDLNIMALIPQFIFMVITFSRTLGFNLKQFDFKSDLEEIKLDESDNEEVEITLGSDTYKISRFFRKVLRLSKYFILENKIFVIGFASIFALILSLTIYTRLKVYNVEYMENEAIMASSLKYTVTNSYITSTDLSNTIIAKNKSFVLVKVIISNEYNIERVVNRDTFVLEVGDEYINPTFTLNDKFIDIGDGFVPTDIKSGVEKEYVVVFEIDNENIKSDYKFKIKNIRTSIANIDSEYREVIIRPINLDKIQDMGTYSVGDAITLDNLIFKSTDYKVTGYDIKDVFVEDWNYCTNSGVCRKNGVYTILPSTTNKGSVSVLKIASNLNYTDAEAKMSMKKYIKYPSDLLGYYGYISYVYLGNGKSTKLVKIYDSDFDPSNYSYFEVPSELKNASRIELIVSVRGSKYTFNLK